MEKSKLLTFAVVALLLLNLGTLGFLVFGKTADRPPHGAHREPKYQIIAMLHFNDVQQQQYEKLILGHRATIGQIEGNIRMVKNRLYLQLLKDQPDHRAKDSLVNVLATYQKQIEQTHFNHFQDIKKICRPDQLEYYYDLTQELSRIFSKPPHPGHG